MNTMTGRYSLDEYLNTEYSRHTLREPEQAVQVPVAENAAAQQLPYERFVIRPSLHHQLCQQLLHLLVLRPMLLQCLSLMLHHGCCARHLAQPANAIHRQAQVLAGTSIGCSGTSEHQTAKPPACTPVLSNAQNFSFWQWQHRVQHPQQPHTRSQSGGRTWRLEQ